ncbi:cysteine dioxygenase type I [Microthyrium microscopicum]|uniref:Cysteine dioxygenase n=1 Tax=Microthyrium microscopicum TaxID=703497 RepID=A0A6A6U8U0_9PEZI|nr:cysteine dioxygenase type I [Microthyrium microscopicum]
MANHFQQLVDKLSRMLGPDGIDSENIDPSQLLDLMEDYESQSVEWAPCISTWQEEGAPYVRNLVDGGNGKYNLLLLIWKAGSSSRIHDHSLHCCMKMLKGQLQETLFSWPDEDVINRGEQSPPTVKRVKMLKENDVAYISNSIGLHSMTNPDANDFAVSLHLYTPPAQICRVFDKETGESSALKLRL